MTIPKIFAGILWFFFATGSVFFALFLKPSPGTANTFSAPSLLLPIGAALGVAVICGGLRYSLNRISNPWLALIPYALGIIFCQVALFLGAFIAPEFLVIFQALCVAFFIAYLPPFVRLGA